MQLGYQNGITSVVLRLKLRKLSDGTSYTGLDHTSVGLIVGVIADNEAATTAYTVAGSTIETITTLGTFAAPTATKCRFKAVDATNHPGLYEIQIADARWAVSNARSVNITVSGVSDLEQVDTVVQLGNAVSGFMSPTALLATKQNTDYPDDCVLLDPVGGSSGTVVGTNGTARTPSDTFANAATIANSRGKKRIRFVPKASVTISSGTFAAYDIDLAGGDLTLNQNVSLSGATIYSSGLHGSISPDIGGGQNTTDLDAGMWFENLIFPFNVRAESYCYLKNCMIGGASTAMTFTIQGDNTVDPVYLQDCYTSKESGLTFSCGGGADLILNGWYGDFTLTNLAAGTTVVIYGYAKVAIAASCTGGTVRHTSHVEVTNSGSATLDLISEPIALSATEVRSAVGLASANLDDQLTNLPTNTELTSALGTADDAVLVQVALVKAKTDLIPTDPADASDIAALLTAIDDFVDTEVAAIKAKTDNLPASPAAVGSAMVLSSSGIDLILIEAAITAGVALTNDSGAQLTSINARQAMAVFFSTLAGVLSGVSSNAPAFKQGGKPAGNTRVSATVTADGRTTVTLKVPD